ncbi:MAG: four helix bundle protein [Ignavibacteriales bacterium]|nr:four helix bundle protein [Ignavibacteriales bacterium]
MVCKRYCWKTIGANIAEGFGRFSFKENIQFCYYARGSLLETRHWLRRAKKRKLLSPQQESELKKTLQLLSPKLNAYIKVNKQQVSRKTND